MKTDIRMAIRKLVNEEIAKEKSQISEAGEQPEVLSFYDQIIALTKTAGHYISKLDGINKKQMPTQKSANALAEALENLKVLLTDMLKNPSAYLDEDPAQVVQDFESDIDNQMNRE